MPIFGSLVGAGLLGAAGSGAQAGFSLLAQKRQHKFQERMSNTAYQRAMADMRKAGLNPMLATKLGGASTPPGGAAPAPDFAGGLTKGANTGLQVKRTGQEIRNMAAEEDRIGATANRERTSSAQNVAATALLGAQAQTEAARAADLRQSTVHKEALANQVLHQNAKAKAIADLYRGEYGSMIAAGQEVGRAAGWILPAVGGALFGRYGLGRAARRTSDRRRAKKLYQRNLNRARVRAKAKQRESNLVDQYGRPFRKD